ncbi:MAG: NAD(P)H-binding protein [Candidatus Dormibacteraeota bacterium]|nr:NAD(P)H-binding protein [Candidatus Dormibacteraeota bacterium]
MILVTGASGFVGRHVLRRLEGRPRRAMVRNRSRSATGPDVEVVEADLTRPETLEAAVAGVHTIIHTAAITANEKEPYPGAYREINQQGTQNLVAAARRAGVERLVVQSGLGTKPAPQGTYMATRQGLEEAVRESGLPFVILQPSVLFGDGAAFFEALTRLARTFPVVPVLGRGDLKFQPLWIEDLVTCLLKAAEDRGLDGRSIPLGGSEYATLRQIQETISSVLGKRRLLVSLPLPLVRIQARAMSAVLPRPPLTPATLELFSFENATALDACERAFGFRPRGFREHLLAHGLEG